jgi:hypothetical protein
MVVMSRIAGAMQMVMRVSFHCTAKATTKAAMKVEVPCRTKPSFSEVPLLIRFAFVVTWVTGEPLREASKKEMDCWRRRVRKAVRRALVVRREEMEMESWSNSEIRMRLVMLRRTYCPEVNQRKLSDKQIHKVKPR